MRKIQVFELLAFSLEIQAQFEVYKYYISRRNYKCIDEAQRNILENKVVKS